MYVFTFDDDFLYCYNVLLDYAPLLLLLLPLNPLPDVLPLAEDVALLFGIGYAFDPPLLVLELLLELKLLAVELLILLLVPPPTAGSLLTRFTAEPPLLPDPYNPYELPPGLFLILPLGE